MRTALLHLERLRRHYEASVRTYDEISLLDLSHTLRIWADLKLELPKHAPAFRTTLSFKSATPEAKVIRALKASAYVFAFMPGGVITYASDGSIVGGPKPPNPEIPRSIAASCKFNEDGSLQLNDFSVIDCDLDPSLQKAVSSKQVKRCNFQDWFGAEAVRLSYPTEAGALIAVSITREMIIRRVANTLDGSHPSATADTSNKFDAPIHYLLQFQMGGLPLPYFILLKIAQDILSNAPKLLGVKAEVSSSESTP